MSPPWIEPDEERKRPDLPLTLKTSRWQTAIIVLISYCVLLMLGTLALLLATGHAAISGGLVIGSFVLALVFLWGAYCDTWRLLSPDTLTISPDGLSYMSRGKLKRWRWDQIDRAVLRTPGWSFSFILLQLKALPPAQMAPPQSLGYQWGYPPELRSNGDIVRLINDVRVEKTAEVQD